MPFLHGHRRPIPLEERFWAKVEKTDHCWIWTAGVDECGYGLLAVGGGRYDRAHRISWRLHGNSLSDGLCVLHICDNPPCVNPDHLYVGTRDDNSWDKVIRQRPGIKLSPGDIPLILARYVDGDSQQAIADSFGVSQGMVSSIVNGRSWRRVLAA